MGADKYGRASIITCVPYVDNMYCTSWLGELVTHKQTSSEHGRIREININWNRHELQQLVREKYSDTELVLLMDSDVMATKEQVEALLDAFDGSPIALRTKTFDTGKHICCACCLLKMEDYLAIDYIETLVDACQCHKIMTKFGVKYIEGYQACEYRDYSIQSNLFHGDIVPIYIENANTGGVL